MHENVFSYVTLNVNTIVHNKKLTIVIVYTVQMSHNKLAQMRRRWGTNTFTYEARRMIHYF